jgi:hypothetical protein
MNFLSTLAQRYAHGFNGLCGALAQRASENRAISAVLMLLYYRLRRTLVRLDRLVVRWQAGEDMRPRARKPRAEGAAPVAAKPPVLRLPARQMWLTKILQPVAWQILQWSSAITQLLDDPEVKALVAAAPQTGRLLRPLCLLFEMPVPEYLRLPKRVRKPRAPRAPKPRATPSARRERQGPARGFTRKQIDAMSVADLLAHYGKLPPHFPLPIPNLNYIRRKIATG